MCDVWTPIGTTRSVSYYFNARYGGAYLRVRVTDSAGTERSRYHGVAVSPARPAGGDAEGAAARGALPEALTVEAFPNPLAAAAEVRFGLPEPGAVRLAVFDALGREVARLAEGAHAAGWHSASLDAAALPSGAYVVRLTAGTHAEAIAVTVLR